MRNDYTLNDQLDHLTVLYHRGCKKGFKFFGDDPEEQKYYIQDEHIEIAKSLWPKPKKHLKQTSEVTCFQFLANLHPAEMSQIYTMDTLCTGHKIRTLYQHFLHLSKSLDVY